MKTLPKVNTQEWLARIEAKQPDPPPVEPPPEVQPTQAPPAADSDPSADSPDPLYHACHDPAVTYPKRVIWPDGETVYRDGTELYADLWQRSMVKEALTLGGELHAPQP